MKPRRTVTVLLGFLAFFATIIRGAQNKIAPEQYGRICALGDFDADLYTDIVAVTGGRNLTIMIQDNKVLDVRAKKNEQTGIFTNLTTWEISEVDLGDTIECVLGDFNGDSRVDIMVAIRKGEKEFEHSLWIAVEERPNVMTYKRIDLATLGFQAMAVDVNNDGRHDVLGFYPNGSLFCTGVDRNGAISILDDCRNSFKAEKEFPLRLDLIPGMPALFADLNDGPPDLLAELIFMTKENNDLKFAVFQRAKSSWRQVSWIPNLPYTQYPYYGAPMVLDLDADGVMDVVVPICREEECRHVTSFAMCGKRRRGWLNVAVDLQDQEVHMEPNSRMMFRVGDFSQDGYPDFIALLINTPANGKTPYSKVIENVECKNCEKNGTRKFEIKKVNLVQPKDMALGMANVASYFDLDEDGSLDMIVEYVYNNKIRFGFIYCGELGDTTFLKLQVFTAVCTDRCSPRATDLGSGISWAGACASFTMSDGWGGSAQSISCLVPSITHRTFTSPYLLFGLGRSPNFVDELHIGIPKYAERQSDKVHTMKQIVPNSRLVVLPPSDSNGHWQSRLYVTPSKLIMQSILVIASVCMMLLMVVAVLHWREKKEDRYERQQQSYRFHFDAM